MKKLLEMVARKNGFVPVEDIARAVGDAQAEADRADAARRREATRRSMVEDELAMERANSVEGLGAKLSTMTAQVPVVLGERL